MQVELKAVNLHFFAAISFGSLYVVHESGKGGEVLPLEKGPRLKPLPWIAQSTGMNHRRSSCCQIRTHLGWTPRTYLRHLCHPIQYTCSLYAKTVRLSSTMCAWPNHFQPDVVALQPAGHREVESGGGAKEDEGDEDGRKHQGHVVRLAQKKWEGTLILERYFYIYVSIHTWRIILRLSLCLSQCGVVKDIRHGCQKPRLNVNLANLLEYIYSWKLKERY